MKPTVYVVLVRPKFPTNIGATARACANMGAEQLILIEPQCGINSKAKQGAAGAQDMLRTRQAYDSWEEFYERSAPGVRIGFTRREGKQRSVIPTEDAITALIEGNTFVDHPKLYLFFGPEDSGLSTEDLEFMNYKCCLPVYGEFKSINLSHAVMLALFVVQQQLMTLPNRGSSIPSEAVNNSTYEFPEPVITQWLTTLGYDLDDRRISAYTKIKNIVLRGCPNSEELKVFEKILQQNIRLLKKP